MYANTRAKLEIEFDTVKLSCFGRGDNEPVFGGVVAIWDSIFYEGIEAGRVRRVDLLFGSSCF